MTGLRGGGQSAAAVEWDRRVRQPPPRPSPGGRADPDVPRDFCASPYSECWQPPSGVPSVDIRTPSLPVKVPKTGFGQGLYRREWMELSEIHTHR